MKRLVAAVACALVASAPLVHAQDQNWVVKVGVHSVDPKSDNGTLAGGALKSDVGADVKPTITAEYFFAPAWGVEVLASLPWEHDIKLNGVKAGTTKQLPPTVNAAMALLPEELRVAITLREIEGLSYEEIAEMMGCPIGTVRSRIFRAREAIAAKLRPLLDTPEGKRW